MGNVCPCMSTNKDTTISTHHVSAERKRLRSLLSLTSSVNLIHDRIVNTFLFTTGVATLSYTFRLYVKGRKHTTLHIYSPTLSSQNERTYVRARWQMYGADPVGHT